MHYLSQQYVIFRYSMPTKPMCEFAREYFNKQAMARLLNLFEAASLRVVEVR